MTRSPDQPGHAAVADEAVGWFTRLQSEAATRQDWLAFEQWLAASPDHMAAYERVEAVWLELDDAAGMVARPAEPAPVVALRRPAGQAGFTRRGWMMGAGLAASVALAAGVGVATWPRSAVEVYSAAPGRTERVVLADGTHVWLNAGSRIDVRLGRRARRVEMADGEALFDVTHDPNRPFLIDAGEREVRVVGTQFNLRRRADEFALTVSRGVVEVRKPGAGAGTRVAAGQSLVRQRGSATFVLGPAAPETALAWTRGQLVYSEAPLSEVAADLSRSLGSPVRVADAAAGELRFSGVLEVDDKAAVLRRLESFAPVVAEQGPQGVTLRRREATRPDR